MTITLYKNMSRNEVVDKSLTTVSTLTGAFKNESDIINPVVLIKASALPSANYAYIAELNRYYYITDIVIIRAGLFELHLAVDVLKTYQTVILNSKAIVTKTGSAIYANEMINQNHRVSQSAPALRYYEFPSGFNGWDDTAANWAVMMAGPIGEPVSNS